MTTLGVVLEDGSTARFPVTGPEGRSIAAKLKAERALRRAGRLLGEGEESARPLTASERADAILASNPQFAETLKLEPTLCAAGSSEAAKRVDRLLATTEGRRLGVELGIPPEEPPEAA